MKKLIADDKNEKNKFKKFNQINVQSHLLGGPTDRFGLGGHVTES